jgi:predicted transcriptional regulator
MTDDANGPHELDAFAQLVARGEEPGITGRELLRMFGAKRRGPRVVSRIRRQLAARKLLTVPDFTEVWVDVPLRIRAVPTEVWRLGAGGPRDEFPDGAVDAEHWEPVAEPDGPTQDEVKKAERGDPVHRIGILPAANKVVDFISPGSLLRLATTKMMMEDYSQLPILQSERSCKGAVTWQSIAETTALGKTCEKVEDCIVPVEDVPWNAALLDVIPKIVDRGFVLVRGPDNTFQGIVTVADLSLQFRLLSEPFLLLGQIENLLRILIERSFTLEEIRSAKHKEDSNREVNSAFDLNFGEYARLLERTESWPKLNVSFDRTPFLKRLEEVRALRNEVMHFDPDPLEESDLTLLRQFTAFLQRVV